ncbi:prepilin-type N-terminal cleavage/methylation domain-containing protein [Planctomycetota bacterium]|nr:prepilin-type N-terminal cleavage/methylation domain-containing protein [Planctomycetota bacterium]
MANRIRTARKRDSGFTLVEVGVAMFILSVVALAGIAYYGNARIGEYNQWHEQGALYLSEREVESWQGGGYVGQAGWGAGQGGSASYLPYGYAHQATAPTGVYNGWTVASSTKNVTSGGMQYFVRAQLLGTPTSGTDYRASSTWDPNGTGTPFTYYYRRVVVHIKWGGSDFASASNLLSVETRIAE